MRTHALKIDAAPLNDLLSGAKTGEVRNDDRDFEVGDAVHLTCSDGRTMVQTISHIQRGYGLPDGICVLSYTRPTPPVKRPANPALTQHRLHWNGDDKPTEWREGNGEGAYPASAFLTIEVRRLYDQPAAPVEGLETIVKQAMQDEWEEICTDTGCHPLDIEHGCGKRLSFIPMHWASAVAASVRSQAEAIIAAKDAEIKRTEGVIDWENIRRSKAEADNVALTARMKELEALIDRLEQQALKDRNLRNEAQSDADLWRFSVDMGDHPSLLVKVWKQRKALETQLAAARKALEPFALRADRYNEIPGLIRFDDSVELWQDAKNKGFEVDITVGDLRSARAALEAKP